MCIQEDRDAKLVPLLGARSDNPSDPLKAFEPNVGRFLKPHRPALTGDRSPHGAPRSAPETIGTDPDRPLTPVAQTPRSRSMFKSVATAADSEAGESPEPPIPWGGTILGFHRSR